MLRYALSFFASTQSDDEQDILNNKYQDLSPSLNLQYTSYNSLQTRDLENSEKNKLHWELQFQSRLAELEAEQAHLDSLPFIVYSAEILVKHIPSQNKRRILALSKRRILAHGCLPPVKNCKHQNKHFVANDVNIPSHFCEISIVPILKKLLKAAIMK